MAYDFNRIFSQALFFAANTFHIISNVKIVSVTQSSIKLRVDIYPLPGVELSGEYPISDHINLSGVAPRLGFNPITELYTHKHTKGAIVVACLKPGTKPTNEEASVLKANGVQAYCYGLLEAALYAAAQGIKVEAYGFVPQAPQGFHFYAGAAGIKVNADTLDLGLIVSDYDCYYAGAFTINQARAICVEENSRIYNAAHKVRAMLCNSGNANACTGVQGDKDDKTLRETVAQNFELKADEVLTASTGKIGITLPLDKLVKQIKQFTDDEAKSQSLTAIQGFSEAILTTDLISKLYQDSKFNVLGMTKGSGMIHPQMATMLTFLVSDVKLKNHSDAEMQQAFRTALKEAADESFNSISVDGDTSTNDMVLFLSNAQGKEISLEEFKASLKEVCRELALKIILDGEGTNRVIQLKLYGISDRVLARKIAKQIVNSLLVKTAIYGCDPNWGRIISALGQATAERDMKLDVKQVSLDILGQRVYEAGMPTNFNKPDLVKLMQQHKFIELELRAAPGDASVTVWGSDLSYDYIRINAEYTT